MHVSCFTSAAVCELVAEMDGKRLLGVIKERDLARSDYETSISAGNSAVMLMVRVWDVSIDSSLSPQKNLATKPALQHVLFVFLPPYSTAR
jgi:hypothetical protein